MKHTKQEVRSKVATLRNQGFNVTVDNAFGQDKLIYADSNNAITPRTNPGTLMNYVIPAFEAGVKCERVRANGNEFSGWSNYETCMVHIGLTNDSKSNDYWRNKTEAFLSPEVKHDAKDTLTKEQRALFDLADFIKEHVQNANPIKKP